MWKWHRNTPKVAPIMVRIAAGSSSSGPRHPGKDGYGLSMPRWELRVKGLGFSAMSKVKG